MTTVNRPKRMLVRTMIVTSATITMLVGAQMLALTDRQATSQTTAMRAAPSAARAPITRAAPIITLLNAEENGESARLAVLASGAPSER